MKNLNILQLDNFIKSLFENKQINYRYLDQGRMNYIYLIILSNGNKVILKMQHMLEEKFSQGFGKEIELFKNLKIKEYIPKMYCTGKFKNRNFALMEYINGQEINFNSENEKFYKIGKTLKKIHEKTNKKLSRSRKKKLYKNYLLNYIKKLDNDVEKKIILKYMDKFLKNNSLKNKFYCLLHHDYHLKNIISYKKEKIKIIDWDSSRYGFDEVDFIKFKHLNFMKMSNEQKSSFIYGYTNNKILKITNLIIIAELLWLIRMEKFENELPQNKEDNYFPNINYYKEKKEKLIKKLTSEKKVKIKTLDKYFEY